MVIDQENKMSILKFILFMFVMYCVIRGSEDVKEYFDEMAKKQNQLTKK